MASIGLVVLTPLFLVVAVTIFVVDGWPVLFVHHRVGRGGREFPIVKFRTMVRDMPKYAPKVAEGDPRITGLGRFLRHTNIDELPQLLNVLVGHMSLIGPRPEQPFIVDDYEPWQHGRHHVRPGITGPWQALGRLRPLEESTDLDVEYIRRRSLGLDMWIAWRTLLYLLRLHRPLAPPTPTHRETTALWRVAAGAPREDVSA